MYFSDQVSPSLSYNVEQLNDTYGMIILGATTMYFYDTLQLIFREVSFCTNIAKNLIKLLFIDTIVFVDIRCADNFFLTTRWQFLRVTKIKYKKDDAFQIIVRKCAVVDIEIKWTYTHFSSLYCSTAICSL